MHVCTVCIYIFIYLYIYYLCIYVSIYLYIYIYNFIHVSLAAASNLSLPGCSGQLSVVLWLEQVRPAGPGGYQVQGPGKYSGLLEYCTRTRLIMIITN